MATPAEPGRPTSTSGPDRVRPSAPPVTATTACNTAPARTAMPQPASLPPLSQPSKALPPEEAEAQGKADKIKLALEKLKEAKVKKLVIKVLMNDGSSKTLMVDETQTVRDVLDNLFEKTHCDCGVDWTLFETNPELQIERGFEDHEFLVDILSAWTRDSENKILFLERRDKYAVFKNPQFYYLWKKQKSVLEDMKEQDKGLLITENFCKGSIIVPDLEGPLYLKEDGKKSWKRRYFLLRASGIYYVPKGKTKTSSDLACFVQFDNVNVYYGMEFKNKYKAPTEHCFILKHPQIQKESQYIRYLCCDDKRILDLWVTSIRIAKYGETLYENYKTAVRKASGTSGWTSRIASNASAASPVPKAKAANGHAPQASLQPKATPTTAISEAKDLGDDQPNLSYPPPPPATESCPPPHLPNPALPPPPPPSLTPRTVPPKASTLHSPLPATCPPSSTSGPRGLTTSST
ncbi:hypothetical protein AGOR_G00042760 [Albula goreensis]|uniref:Amyloid beta A4 precursor protein-binding family B member 1-interacting protein n=1 Tax=Albula goreensis TaxID=1534307 RepID=A0A8T3DY50_9TELE|nr:hypothetical protein AGOR_G00042760 [Albula goreensis]